MSSDSGFVGGTSGVWGETKDMTRDELHRKLTADAEQAINEVLGRMPEQDMTLTELEDVALAARKEIGARILERMLEYQVDRHSHELPVGSTGKSMQTKGKKAGRS
jgi:hypothetical protein